MIAVRRLGRARRPRAGAVLLEAMIAITLIAIAGVGMVTHLGQTIETIRHVHERDRAARSASRELDRLSLLRNGQLAARIGRSRIACCDLVVEPITPVLYRVALADTTTGAFLLETAVYAADTTSNSP
jgi:hypothetical protein